MTLETGMVTAILASMGEVALGHGQVMFDVNGRDVAVDAVAKLQPSEHGLGNAGARITKPYLACRESDITDTGICPGRCVNVRGEIYTVTSPPEPNGHGMVRIYLRRGH